MRTIVAILLFFQLISCVGIAQDVKKTKDSVISYDKIILRNLHLQSFPQNISNLDKIEILDISGNCFFPSSLSSFINLRKLIGQNLFEETCGSYGTSDFSINQLMKLEKLEEINLSGISVEYISEHICNLTNLKKINISSGQYPLSMLHSDIKEVGLYTPLISMAERENLSTIYYGKYYNSNMPVKTKVNIPATGLFTNFYLNGQKLVEGNFIDKKPDGKWTFWFESGKVSQVRFYKSGVEVGQWVILNEFGDSLLIENFINGKLDTYERRHDKKDNIRGTNKIFNYSDTSKRYSSGFFWRGDVKISTYASKHEYWTKETSFFKNKNKAVEITYNKLHQFHGYYTIWYEDGKIKEERNYFNGELHGEQRYWNDLGKIYQIDTYSDGKLIRSTFEH